MAMKLDKIASKLHYKIQDLIKKIATQLDSIQKINIDGY